MMRDQETGLSYRVTHDRAFGPEQNLDGDYLQSQKGGRTVVEMIDDDGNVLAVGEAVARPDENYNRKLGRIIALGRAKKQLQRSSADPAPGVWHATLVEFADLWNLATREADAAGTCFVHFDGASPVDYVLMTPERYRSLVARVIPDGQPVPVDDPDWSHSHVEPEMLNDLAVMGAPSSP